MSQNPFKEYVLIIFGDTEVQIRSILYFTKQGDASKNSEMFLRRRIHLLCVPRTQVAHTKVMRGFDKS